MRFNIMTWVAVSSLVQGTSHYARELARGDFWAIPALLGFLIMLITVVRICVWIVRTELKTPGTMKKMFNMIGNLSRCFLQMHADNQQKFVKLVALLTLPSEQFKKQMNMNIPD